MCLPLWADAGVARSGGFLGRLQLNHRPFEEDGPGSAADQAALIELFRLAGAAGFDTERAERLIEDARAQIGDAADTPAPDADVFPGDARTLRSQCRVLSAALIELDADGEAEVSSAAACAAFDDLMDDFLTFEGGWIVGYDADGLPLSAEMPAQYARDIARVFAPLIALAET